MRTAGTGSALPRGVSRGNTTVPELKCFCVCAWGYHRGNPLDVIPFRVPAPLPWRRPSVRSKLRVILGGSRVRPAKVFRLRSTDCGGEVLPFLAMTPTSPCMALRSSARPRTAALITHRPCPEIEVPPYYGVLRLVLELGRLCGRAPLFGSSGKSMEKTQPEDTPSRGVIRLVPPLPPPHTRFRRE